MATLHLKTLKAEQILDMMGLKNVAQEDEFEWKALCPFHNESTPSFGINFAKSVYYCFGCGKSGTVNKLMRRFLGVDYLQAAVMAAFLRPGGPVERKPKTLEVLPESYLTQYQPLARSQYLWKRGILHNATLRDFDIRWDETENRIVIPIRHVAGELVGFVTRAIDPKDNKPRYLHSISAKTMVLFNLNRLVAAHEPVAVVVEGPMDVLRAHDAGFPFCVATLGQALSAEQVGLLKQHTATVFLAFDNDEEQQGRLYESVSTIRLQAVGIEGRRLRVPRHRKDFGDCTDEEIEEVLTPVRIERYDLTKGGR